MKKNKMNYLYKLGKEGRTYVGACVRTCVRTCDMMPSPLADDRRISWKVLKKVRWNLYEKNYIKYNITEHIKNRIEEKTKIRHKKNIEKKN